MLFRQALRHGGGDRVFELWIQVNPSAANAPEEIPNFPILLILHLLF